VAVADTAVAARPEFAGRIVADDDSLLPAQTNDVLAEAGHGTFVTGVVLQAAPSATVYVQRVLDIPQPGDGADFSTDSWTVAKKLVGLARDDAQVINLSLGCHTDDNQPPLVFQRALDKLGPDVVVVAAAGNFAPHQPVRPVWPAALDGVVAVGATDATGRRASYSPDPARAPWVNVEAPGDGVTSVFLEGKVVTALDGKGASGAFKQFEGFARWSGTSFAAARVTGLLASKIRPGEVGPREALAQLLRQATRRPWLA
jgi:hypothetical protein